MHGIEDKKEKKEEKEDGDDEEFQGDEEKEEEKEEEKKEVKGKEKKEEKGKEKEEEKEEPPINQCTNPTNVIGRLRKRVFFRIHFFRVYMVERSIACITSNTGRTKDSYSKQ